MPVTYTEILRTDCLGDSRAKINNNFNNFKSAVIALRAGVTGGTWTVNLGTMMPLSGSHCIGDSLLTINQNIALLKDSLQEIKTEAGSLLSGCSIEFDEITQIAPNECIGDSRNKLNYIFDFLLSAHNCFDSYI